jgi:hypothetical protein
LLGDGDKEIEKVYGEEITINASMILKMRDNLGVKKVLAPLKYPLKWPIM